MITLASPPNTDPLAQARAVMPGNAPATAPFVPDDAPFSPEQRQWLNGFLTGLTVVARGRSGSASAEPSTAATPLTVLYGSQSGNCEALSKILRKAGKAKGFDPKVTELDAFDFNQLSETAHLLIVTSTFGEGDPPDNAIKFCERLAADDVPGLAGVSYAVCGLGDSSYTHFNKCARDIDERLAELGAQRVADAVLCDVDYEDDFAAWSDAVFASESFMCAAGGSVDLPEPGEAVPTLSRYDKKNPFAAILLDVTCLNKEGSSKEVNHVELSLAGSGLEYEAGDALGVWPVNCTELVQQLLDAGGWTGREAIQLKTGPTSLREALIGRLDTCVVTPALYESAGFDGTEDHWKESHVLDVIEAAASLFDAQAFVDTLRPLTPRLYSIASSPTAHPGEVHLTVGAVRYHQRDKPRKGVASTFLADRCPVGGKVGVYVHKSAHFHLPQDEAPLIMIGPGTGIAPFRAFLEERETRGAVGKSWLFFGDRNEATDFLYREQFETYLASGRLDRLDAAWSRDRDEKVYVQDKMREAGEELFAWLENGACVFVCGDASRMAQDVDAALHDIIAKQGGLSLDEAEAYVNDLKSNHRYQRDVY